MSIGIEKNNWEDVPRDYTGVIESKDGRFYLLDGTRHRIDGPACEWNDGVKSWYLNGIWMSEAEHSEKTRPMITTLGKLIWRAENDNI